MAKLEELKDALERLNDDGPIKLGGEELKKKILKSKLMEAYGEDVDPDSLDELVKDIYENGRGELMAKLDSDLAMISGSLNSVVKQAPILLSQMGTMALSKIQTSTTGPTVPNPLDIKNSLDQIKAQASTLGSLLGQALGKVIELGIADQIPDSVVSAVNVIATIKKFPL